MTKLSWHLRLGCGGSDFALDLIEKRLPRSEIGVFSYLIYQGNTKAMNMT